MQKMLAGFNTPPENIVFVSGIGCSSRFPYYMNTYGFHSIHGRAPTLATGLKISRPDLLVFVITGDGDGLSIGGNHLLHALRRNIDINIILFNNRIYGLTKGQFSPTSEVGKKTKSSPMGTIENPLNPISVALAAEATFVARSFDTDPRHLMMTLERSARHQGSSFVEIYQNCNIFNDGAFRDFTDKPVRKQRMIYLKNERSMLFGEQSEYGIALDGTTPRIVDADGPDNKKIIVHQENDEDPTIANILARIDSETMPIPVGVFREIQKPVYGDLLAEQINSAKKLRGDGDLESLIRGENVWTVT